MPASVLFRPSITRHLKTALTVAAIYPATHQRSLEPVRSGAAANTVSRTPQQPAKVRRVNRSKFPARARLFKTSSRQCHRRSRTSPKPEGHITKQQAKDLFRSVDEILGFVSGDTGLPIEHKVNRKLITREMVQKYVDKRMKDDKDEKRLEQARLVLQKFGLLPAGLRPAC